MNQPDGKNQDQFRSAVTMTVVWVAGLTLGGGGIDIALTEPTATSASTATPTAPAR